MTETIQLGDIAITVTRKDIKHVHLSVYPPDGRVTLAAPVGTRLEVARAYAISKLGWIRSQREQLRHQARETSRRFVERESHFLWGRRHLLTIAERHSKPCVTLDHKRITLRVRPGSDQATRARVIHDCLSTSWCTKWLIFWSPRTTSASSPSSMSITRRGGKRAPSSMICPWVRSSGWNDRMESRMTWLSACSAGGYPYLGKAG